MPICRFQTEDSGPAYALYRVHQQTEQICPLSELSDSVPEDNSLFDLGISWVSGLPAPREDQWREAPSRLLPPVADPSKVICIGLNYRDHAIETGAEIPTEPVVSTRFGSTVIYPMASPYTAQSIEFLTELKVFITYPVFIGKVYYLLNMGYETNS